MKTPVLTSIVFFNKNGFPDKYNENDPRASAWKILKK